MREREVVAINPDGSVKMIFPSIKEASERMGVSYSTLCKRLRIMGLVKGYRVMYEDDRVTWLDYSFNPNRKRVRKRGAPVFSEERRRILSDTMKKNRPWEKRKARKVMCLETGEVFASRREAAAWLGLPGYRISDSICKHHRIKGFTLIYAMKEV